jgi:hypothetical protein
VLAARAAAVTAAVALTSLLALSPGAAAAPSYAVPSGAWAQFQSDLNGAEGLATGRGVTIALLSTGADTGGFGGRVSHGPDYIFKPEMALTHAIGTLTAGLILGVPGAVRSSTRRATALRYIVVDSFSYLSASPALLSAASYALSRNAVIVGMTIDSAGQQNWKYQYPSGIPGVIGVSALMLPGGPAPFSSSSTEANNSVLIAGPADTMLASSTGWQLDDFGTAGALVAATAALIKERYPHLSRALVGRALAMSARDHPKGGYAPSVGFGVLDPYDAILDAGKLAAVTTTAQAGPGLVAARAGRVTAACAAGTGLSCSPRSSPGPPPSCGRCSSETRRAPEPRRCSRSAGCRRAGHQGRPPAPGHRRPPGSSRR